MKEFEDRWYQIEAEDALLEDVEKGFGNHPVIAIPTGGGKTKILGSFIYKYLELHPRQNILVLSHTENILLQDYEAIQSFFKGIQIGLYSSGLKSRSIEKITVAGIQSVYRNAKYFKRFHLCIIDEAHTVPTKGNGMYKQLFNHLPNLRRVGLTATHFRTGHGYIHEGKGAMFNKLSYDLCTMDKFNRLVEEGYLCKIFSKPTSLQLKTEGVKVSAGDYNLKDLSEKFDRKAITEKAVNEVIEFGQHNYKSWLVFAIDIEHAEHINKLLQEKGIKSKALHSKNVKERHTITQEFKDGDIKCVVSVGMITTGFDAPNIDLIILLRPTKSPVLHVQMIGRGLRITPDKDHCLVLDFSGNTSRLGPINNVTIPKKGKKGKGNGEPLVKDCPNCGCQWHIKVKICDACGHKFKFQEKIKPNAGYHDVVQYTPEKWFKVSKVRYKIHNKVGMPDSLKVTYSCGLSTFSEYICLDHGGYAGHKASYWVRNRWVLGSVDLPLDVRDLYYRSQNLREPNEILIDSSSKFPSIKDATFL